MRELTVDERRADLINDLLVLEKVKADLWEHHPDNPNKIDVVASYNNIKARIEETEKILSEL